MNVVTGSQRFVDIVTDLLNRGYRVRFRAEGPSMRPTIRGGETITVEPVLEVKMGDIALYRAERGLVAHRVVAIRKMNGKAPVFAMRGEAIGSSDEAVNGQQLLGKVVAVERNGQNIDLEGRWAKLRCRARRFACLARHWCAMLGRLHYAGVFLLLSALAAIFPSAARANITVTSQTSALTTSGNTCTLSGFDTSTGSPNTILVSVSGTNANSFTTPTIAGGATVTLLNQNLTGSVREAVWSITGFTPSVSSTITFDTGGGAGMVCGATAFSGVASVGTIATATGTATPPQPSVAVENPGPGGVIFDTITTGGGGAEIVAPDPPQVQQWNASPAGNRDGAASVAPPQDTMSWTLSTSQAWYITAVPLIPLETTEVQPTSFTVTQRLVQNQIQNVIELKTGREVRSLGFNLYREQNGQRIKLNSSLLAGTALLAGSTTTLTAGHVHTWWDVPAGASSSAKYWVEEVDLNGQRSWYGPATPTAARTGAAKAVNSNALTTDAKGQVMLLSQVGQTTGAPGAGVRTVTHPVRAHPVRTANISAAREKQFALAAGHAVKIGVESEGWYRVSWASLVAAGLPANADASTLQLYAEGVQQPMLVHARSDIEFYGTGIDTTWSDMRTYWLTWGQASGERVQTDARKTATGAGASSFPYTVEWTPRTVYFAALLDGDGSNNFFGPVLTSGDPVSQAVTLTHLNQNGPSARLQVSLQGVSMTSHSVEVALNGREVGAVTFSNQTVGTETMPIPAGVLLEGKNELTLTVAGGDSDVGVIGSVQLTYPHSYSAESDSLSFTAEGGQAQTIGGFSNSQITVVDVSNPDAAAIVPGTITQQAGSYSVTVVPQGGGSRALMAFTGAQEAVPASVTTHHPSSWHASQAGYDMVMISHANFVQSLAPLAAFHQGQGLKAAVIDVEDLYDEFNFGEKSPNAIKDFLSTAKSQWQLAPRFVMLVGDATYDPRNYLGAGNFDFVPTYLVDTALLQTASDDWYSDFSGTGLPQMAIGRLPVRTAQEASALVSKIVAYGKSGDAAWKQQVLLVEDQNDSADNFQGDAAAVKALLPASLTVSEISQTDPGASEELLNSLNVEGAAMVDYMGHGSEEVWSSGLFNSTVASSLTNGSMVPFVVSMTCLNGYYQDVYGTALAKALMEAPGGGALAVWASSGLTDSGTQAAMNQALVKSLFSAEPLTIGEAAASAKTAVSDLDVRRTWILFGDPATKLQ